MAAVLGPVTNYASDAVPGWAAQAWVIWPVFAVLVVVSIVLLLWGRRSGCRTKAPGAAGTGEPTGPRPAGFVTPPACSARAGA